MSKDPAFLFYPNDWLGGTIGMTFEEKGAYMELLMMQFNRGHMTTDMCGYMVGQLWDKIKDKFDQDENGLWFNKRLEEEQLKRKSFTESRRNNIKGNNQYSKNGGHTTSRMENENENENEIIIKKENKIKTREQKKEAYRSFAHLSISVDDFDKLIASGFTKENIDNVLDKIENWSGNKKYKSLYLTALNWLKDEAAKKKAVPTTLFPPKPFGVL